MKEIKKKELTEGIIIAIHIYDIFIYLTAYVTMLSLEGG